jgi:hypothetical protein
MKTRWIENDKLFHAIIKTRSPKKAPTESMQKEKKKGERAKTPFLYQSLVFFPHINVQSVSIFLENMRILA